MFAQAEGDYKYGIQMIAEELADTGYQKEFYDLSEDLQQQIFLKAEEMYWENVRQRDELRYGS